MIRWLVLLCLFLSPSVWAQHVVVIKWTKRSDMPAAQTVYYDTAKPLVWADFKGRPETGGMTAALTTAGFGYGANMGFTESKSEIRIDVYCYFDKSRSWVKPDRKTDYILNHEQRHYDLAFIAAARFVSALRLSGLSANNLNEQLKLQYDSATAWMQTMQDRYDKETRNGLDRAEQEEWNEQIDALLREAGKEL